MVLGMYGPASVYNRVTEAQYNSRQPASDDCSVQHMRIRNRLTSYPDAFGGPLTAFTSDVSSKNSVRLPATF